MAQEANLDTEKWTAFWDKWRDTLKQMPEAKAEVLQKVGEELRDEVKRSILRTGIDDPHGRVRSWQNPHVGSNRGYVAVRSDSVEVQSGGTGRTTVNAGAVTNFLHFGHKIRPPGGTTKKKYYPRIRTKKTYVPGRKFYNAVDAEELALEAANAILERVADELDE